MKKAWSGK